MEKRGSNNTSKSVSRKEKVKKKEGDKSKGVGEVKPMGVKVMAMEENRRYDDVSCSNSVEVNLPVVMGGDLQYQEHEDWRAWLRPGMLVDEQMSWGSTWFSFWEADNSNCNEFYSDVMEDDLWDFKSIQNTPP